MDFLKVKDAHIYKASPVSDQYWELKFLSRSYVAMADDNYPKTADVVLGSPTEDNVASLCLAIGPTIICTHTGSR